MSDPPDPTLLVPYPASAEMYLLAWRTHNQGGNLILARTERGIKTAWDRTVKHHREIPHVEKYAKIQTGPPSQDVIEAIEQKTVENFMFHFQQWVWGINQKIKLPFLKKCRCRDRCDRCFGWQVVPAKNYTWQSIYAAASSMWWEEFGRMRFVRAGRFPYAREAFPKALPDNGLKAACAHFGHHCSGTVLTDIDLADPPPGDSILFFFVEKEIFETPKYVTDAYEKFEQDKIERSKAHKRNMKIREQEYKQRETDLAERLIATVKGNNS